MRRHLQATLSPLIVAAVLIGSSLPYSGTAEVTPAERAVITQAKSIVLPEFKLDGVTLSEALKRLSVAARQNSHDKKGVNFMITEPAKVAANQKITIALKNVTVNEAAERLAKNAGVRLSARDYGFVFGPKSDKP